MSKIIFPSTVPEQGTLYAAINTKHIADDKNSVLIPYFTENGIDLSVGLGVLPKALISNQNRILLQNQSTKSTQLRDNVMIHISSDFKGCVQFLKTFYKANTKKLSDWGITVEGNAKVVYPTAFLDYSKLITNFYNYHLNLAKTSSPLTTYLTENKIDVKAEIAQIATATNYNTDSINFGKQAIKENELMNSIWAPYEKQLHDIGGFLMTLYSNTPRKITDWGFTVEDAAAKIKDIKTKIGIGATIKVTGVVINGTFTNTGNVDLHLYKGKTTNGNPIIVHPTDKVGIKKGFSTITVSNPDTNNTGEFLVTRHH